jgi:carbon-monoxide dehydrogenase medium subunit
MYPASFDYHAPREVSEATELLAHLGDEAKVLAGGCSLIPLMKLRLAEPAHLVDLRLIGELHGLGRDDDRLVIGAMTREAEIESSAVIREHVPLLAEVSAVIADPLVRNMGTIGGNLAHADPANDHPAAVLATDAVIEIAGPGERRHVPATSFFRDLFTTDLRPGEIVTAIRVPTFGPTVGCAYLKEERQVGDFAIVGVAVRIELRDGLVREPRVALTNVGPVATRAHEAETLLEGRAPSGPLLAQAGEAAVEGLAPWDELRGSADYKRRLVPVIVSRALRAAARRAGASDV